MRDDQRRRFVDDRLAVQNQIEIDGSRGAGMRARPSQLLLDLDLILYGDRIIDEPPTLIVPHPRFRERRFVLEPLADVAADWTDPVTGLTIARLLENLADVERGYRSE